MRVEAERRQRHLDPLAVAWRKLERRLGSLRRLLRRGLGLRLGIRRLLELGGCLLHACGFEARQLLLGVGVCCLLPGIGLRLGLGRRLGLGLGICLSFGLGIRFGFGFSICTSFGLGICLGLGLGRRLLPGRFLVR